MLRFINRAMKAFGIQRRLALISTKRTPEHNAKIAVSMRRYHASKRGIVDGCE